ncbi:MAG: hypothetical protein CVU11_01590 [Bacteroidetes bacterium HGW-Bacteroidetes-6]|jgi:hypothetical protein|nr:MAG: hypothetical protein CVU11_01590 [Bacteroidetes bacterium HGW-Bacteroidetes-6]
MKTVRFLCLIASFALITSCGNSSKQENEEMQAHQDSIKKDTQSVNNSVNAANDFLNNDSVSIDSVAVK